MKKGTTLVLAGNRMRDSFSKAGFNIPKNFIELRSGEMLLESCIYQLSFRERNIVCVLPEEEFRLKEFELLKMRLQSKEITVNFVPIPETTSAVQSALWAADYFSDGFLEVVPGDVLVYQFAEFNKSWVSDNYMVTTRGFDERWGFIDVRNDELVTYKSKSAISDLISIGFFQFARSSDFIEAAEDCLLSRSNVEPIQIGHIAELIGSSQPISVYEVPENTFFPLAGAGDIRRFWNLWPS